MIAMTANYFVVSFAAIRSLYPSLWRDVEGFSQKAKEELSEIPQRNRKLQILAGLPPMLAAALLMLGQPTQFEDPEMHHFRVLIAILILAGLFGSWFATAAAGMQLRYVHALTSHPGR
jgi:hypothetical protein